MPKRKKKSREKLVDLLLIPQALKRMRVATGLRQVDVSDRSGLTKAMVSAYEGGKLLPSLPSLSSYLDAIGRDMADLQEAVHELGGFPRKKTDDDDARERAIGRAVLKALRGLEELAPEPDSTPPVTANEPVTPRRSRSPRLPGSPR
jgi:transcriptional regulator with XRE-family HTH domain